jgi:uncharacterized membrane protein HdeD (DUF308 family)
MSAIAESKGKPGAVWWLMVLGGVLSVIAGFLVLVFPGLTLLLLAWFLGFYFLIAGAFELMEAFMGDETAGGRVLMAVLGALSIIVGLLVLREPGQGVLALALLLGVYFVAMGALSIARAASQAEGRGLLIFVAILDLAIGAIILVQPALGVATLVLLVWIRLLLRGVLLIGGGFQLKRAVG